MTADLDALRQHLNDAHAALESANRSAQAARGDQLPDFATQIVIDQIYDASKAVSIATAATQHGRTATPTDACRTCHRDFSLPYVTREEGSDRCEDCASASGMQHG